MLAKGYDDHIRQYSHVSENHMASTCCNHQHANGTWGQNLNIRFCLGDEPTCLENHQGGLPSICLQQQTLEYKFYALQ